MSHPDSIELLKECFSGSKMGSDSLHDALSHVKDPQLGDLFSSSRQEHESLGEKARDMLIKRHGQLKDPPLMAQAMSYLKTQGEYALSPNDRTLAGLITQGCNMGITSLSKAMNHYSHADEDSRLIAKDLIDIETRLSSSLRPYL